MVSQSLIDLVSELGTIIFALSVAFTSAIIF